MMTNIQFEKLVLSVVYISIESIYLLELELFFKSGFVVKFVYGRLPH